MGMFTAIHYVVGIPDPMAHEHTPFQGFTEQALDAAGVLMGITQLPANVGEALEPRRKWQEYRACGASVFSTHLLHFRSVQAGVVPSIEAPFWVVILPPGNESLASSFGGEPKPLVLLEAYGPEGPRRPIHFGYALPRIRAWAIKTLVDLDRKGIPKAKYLLDSTNLSRKPADIIRRLPLTRRRHNVTLPSELALEAVGFAFAQHDAFPQLAPRKAPDEPQPHIAAMTEIARAITAEREATLYSIKLPFPPALDLIVGVPSMRSDMHIGKRVWQHRLPAGLDQLSARQLVRVLRIMGRQEHTTYTLTSDELSDLQSLPGQIVTDIRRRELDLLTAATAMKAAEQFCPALRLRPAANMVRPLWNDMARCARGRSPHQGFKLNLLAKKVAARLMDCMDPDLRDVIQGARSHIKLVGDLPFELAPCARLGLPLLLTTAMSRVPTLPGDLALHQLISGSETIVEGRSIRNILVLRSFTGEDPLKGMVEWALREYLGPRAHEVSFVDVTSIQEAEHALREFRGGTVVFDMHGGVKSGVGTLRVGTDDWDLASSSDRIRLPPVVVFSACDTAPIDGTASTVVNAALNGGAKAVMGTLLPVNGRESAVFVGRLALRLYDFIPAAHRAFNRALRWPEVFGGMLRMNYTTDVLRRALRRRATIEQYMDDKLALNKSINVETPDDGWFEVLVSRLAHRLLCSEEDIANRIRNEWYFTETCKYAMFGSPEHLLIVPDTPHQESSPR